MHRAARAWLALLASATVLAGCLVTVTNDDHPARRPASFTALGFVPGFAGSEASAIAGDASTVAGTATTVSGNRQAFRWTAAQGITGLGYPPGGSYSRATGVSTDGSVIVGDGSGGVPAAGSMFRWTQATGIQSIDGLPGSSLCAASGVSGSGSVVAGTCLRANSEALRWTASTGAVSLGRFGGGSDQTSTASAISRDARVIAGAGHPSLTGAVLWPADGAPVVLGKLDPQGAASATALSRDASVVAGWSSDANALMHAFRWTQRTGMVALESGGGGLIETVSTGVSGSGERIVGWGRTASGEVAVIWDGVHGLRTLEAALRADYDTSIPGWTLTRAMAIADEGRAIVGYGTDPQGRTQAWLITLPADD